MKDVFGQELAVGDTVACMIKNYRYALTQAKVLRIGNVKLTVEYRDGKMSNGEPRMETYIVAPEAVVKKPSDSTKPYRGPWGL